MSTYDDDRTAQLLSDALHDEAASVEPSPSGLQAIQRRTSTTRSRSRSRWMLGAVGAGLATAAAITAVVVVNQISASDKTPAAGPSNDGTAHTAKHRGVYDPTAAEGHLTVRLAYLAPATSVGDVSLEVEPHTVSTSSHSRPFAAVHEFLTSTPIDPDYTSGWPAGVDVDGLSTGSDSITTIALTGDADISERGPLTSRQAPMAIQALITTARAGPRAVFTYNGHPMTTLFGVDVRRPVKLLPEARRRAPISIDNLVEGQTVSTPLKVKISGNVFEGTVAWQLRSAAHKQVDAGFVTTAMGEWRPAVIRIDKLRPGTYTLWCAEISMSGDFSVFFKDTKHFIAK
jgi:Immunoglobulin-like domain of bacterial spore germination